MDIQQARSKVLIMWVVGIAISLLSGLSTIVSLMKMLYFRLDTGTQFGGMLAKPFQDLVYAIFQWSNPYLGLFWDYSPTPDQMNLVILDNFIFLLIYLLVFVGMAFISSARKLSRRLKNINERIEDQIIEESMRGEVARTREQIERETEIPSSSIFSQFHQLYLAPVVVGVFVGALLKVSGL